VREFEILKTFHWTGKLARKSRTVGQPLPARKLVVLQEGVVFHIMDWSVTEAYWWHKERATQKICKEESIFESDALVMKPTVGQI
jgi:hypothetical protein